MIKIFLGGTCEGYDWRKDLEHTFKDVEGLELFNPIVDDWTPECVIKENEYKENCDVCLFVITPFMAGCYSVAEAVDVSNKHPERAVFAYIDTAKYKNDLRRFTPKMEKSIKVTGEMIERNGGKFFKSLEEVIEYIDSLINS